jgi:hypothetical protein
MGGNFDEGLNYSNGKEEPQATRDGDQVAAAAAQRFPAANPALYTRPRRLSSSDAAIRENRSFQKQTRRKSRSSANANPPALRRRQRRARATVVQGKSEIMSRPGR